MKTAYMIASALLVLVVGCAGPAANARKTEAAVAGLADGAMKAWAVYYHAATNNPAQFGETLVSVEQQHQQVNLIAKRVGAGLSTLSTFTSAYETNSATEPALTAAISAVSADASQLASLIAGFSGKTNLFK